MFLKYFLNNWSFVKVILKLDFTDDTFYEKIDLRLLGLFLDTPFEIHTLHGNFDDSMCQMPHHRWRICKLGLTRLSHD